MTRIESPLLQSLKIDGRGINPSVIQQVTYIEASDVQAPALILRLWDEYSLLRDDLGLKKGSTLECEFASSSDPHAGAFTEVFIVMVHPINNNIIEIEALQKDCVELKKRVATPRFFVNKTAHQIISELAPGLKVDCTVESIPTTYHLNSGMKPSILLRKIARDHGAACYISRGVLHFHSWKYLAEKKGKIKYSQNSSSGDGIIIGSSIINNQMHYEDVLKKNWMSHGYMRGLEKGGFNGEERVLLPTMEQWQLDNQSVYLLSKIDIEISGNLDLSAGDSIEVEFIKIGDGNIDQSIPQTLIIKKVAHHQVNLSFATRVIAGVVQNHE